MTKPTWEQEFDEQFYYARTNVDDNDYSIIKDKSDGLPASSQQVKDFIRTHFIAKDELVELIEDMDYKESRDPNGKWTTWISKSDLLAKLKEME